jgi:mevalonate kinase
MVISRNVCSFLLLFSFITSIHSTLPTQTSLSFNQQAILLSIKITPVMLGMYFIYDYFQGHRKTRQLIQQSQKTLLDRIAGFKDSILRVLTQQDEKINALHQQINILQQALHAHGITFSEPNTSRPLLQRLFSRS